MEVQEVMIIVHPNEEYTDLMELGNCKATKQNKYLFDRIVDEMKKYIINRDRFYFLPSSLPYSPMIDIMHEGVVIPTFDGECFNEQFVRTKKKLQKDNVKNVSIVGVQYISCVFLYLIFYQVLELSGILL